MPEFDQFRDEYRIKKRWFLVVGLPEDPANSAHKNGIMLASPQRFT